MGIIPILEVNGHAAYQSIAILRYLGKCFGLSGTNDWEDLLVDIVADTFADFRQSKVLTYNEVKVYISIIISESELIAPWNEINEEVKLKRKQHLNQKRYLFLFRNI